MVQILKKYIFTLALDANLSRKIHVNDSVIGKQKGINVVRVKYSDQRQLTNRRVANRIQTSGHSSRYRAAFVSPFGRPLSLTWAESERLPQTIAGLHSGSSDALLSVFDRHSTM